ncbi:MAG: hypothetical protein H6739_23160 [Alphaproteobacteria bacterium]|nr:hypothetical protein [Alphaproteobacteria bacterium]
MRILTLALSLAALLTACGHPQTLQYDYGRAYNDAFDTQTDLTRPSVEDAVYELNGVEGMAIRANVSSETSDEKSGDAETVDTMD